MFSNCSYNDLAKSRRKSKALIPQFRSRSRRLPRGTWIHSSSGRSSGSFSSSSMSSWPSSSFLQTAETSIAVMSTYETRVSRVKDRLRWGWLHWECTFAFLWSVTREHFWIRFINSIRKKLIGMARFLNMEEPKSMSGKGLYAWCRHWHYL